MNCLPQFKFLFYFMKWCCDLYANEQSFSFWSNRAETKRKPLKASSATMHNVAASSCASKNLWKWGQDTFGAFSNDRDTHTHTRSALLFRCWRWKISHSGWQFCRQIPVWFKKVRGDLRGNVRPINETDASSLVQPGPRRKVCYIYGSNPRRGHWYFFPLLPGLF